MDRLSTKGQMIDQINLGNIDSSSFDRRNHNFLSCKLGKLVPTRLDEVYPGDRIVGHVEAVANFEPLAAPIMGSMVMKQESFYIPTSILWKDAHKFFTGKHDFNGSVPSVSPYQIYRAWCDNQYHEDPIKNTALTFLDEDPDRFVSFWWQFVQDMQSMYNTIGNGFQVQDLLKPVRDEFNRYSTQGDYYKLFSDYSELENPTIAQQTAIVDAVLGTLYLWFNFFFGVSSLIDYIGMPSFDNLEDLFFKSGKDENGNYYKSIKNWMLEGSAVMPWDEFTDADLFSSIPLNWLPIRAAYVCWYWNYRDQLLETNALDPESDAFLNTIPSADEIRLLTLLRVRCWYKDTFTTALTNTGDSNLIVPSFSDGTGFTVQYYTDESKLVNTSDASSAFNSGATFALITLSGGSTYKIPMNYLSFNKTSSTDSYNSTSGISLDVFDRIRRLRNFIQKRLILGYEYDDMVWSSFRVKLSNVRMRIPELLARGRDEVTINTIVNNTNTSEQDAGDKTAIAYCHGRTSDINYFAEEHGYFLSFITILPVQSYSGGLQRLWMRSEQFDFMWPEFATMGMDAIYNYELSAPRGKYAKAGLTDDVALQVFGYQGRYYDLKSRQDEEHGRLRTDLNYMTFSREFNMNNKPMLNYQFVHCFPALDMFVTDDPTADVVKCIDVYHAIDFQRRLPVPSEFI